MTFVDEYCLLHFISKWSFYYKHNNREVKMSERMQLAQLNIARTKAAMDEPLMKEFVDNLAPINAIAESSQGFVWRLQDESGDATSIQAFDNPSIIVNMSSQPMPLALSIKAIKL